MIGNANPDFYYGITNNFEYKNFSLNVFFQGVSGNDLMFTLSKRLYSRNPGTNVLSGSLDTRWSSDNPTNAEHDFGRNGRMSTQMLERASYLRLRTLTLGYNVPAKVRGFLGNARFYLTASNIWTLTNYTGLDPAYSDKDNLVKGFDDGYYPLEKSIVLGVRLGL